MPELHRAISLTAPILLGFVAHGLCIRFGWLAMLTRPIDGGLRLRGQRLLGDNKTWRGLVTVGVGTGLGFLLRAVLDGQPAMEPDWLNQVSLNTMAFGFLAGVSAMAFELPNSFLKRQLGIKPGEQGGRLLGVVFHFVDQIDVLAGLWLALVFVEPVTAPLLLWSALFLYAAHQLITVAGYRLGMRKTWR